MHLGGVAISIGLDTTLYPQLQQHFPNLHEVTVNVTEWIPAPRRDQRTRGRWPNEKVIESVRQQQGYAAALSRCQRVLDEQGLVLVGCKGGNHRSPTVAANLRKTEYVVHCTIYNVTLREAQVIVATVLEPAQSTMRHEIIAAGLGHQGFGYLAWDWYGFMNDEQDTPLLESGSILMIETIDRHGYVDVRLHSRWSQRITPNVNHHQRVSRRQIHSGWLLPVRIAQLSRMQPEPASLQFAAGRSGASQPASSEFSLGRS